MYPTSNTRAQGAARKLR